MIIVGILIPTVILKRDKSQASSSTTVATGTTRMTTVSTARITTTTITTSTITRTTTSLPFTPGTNLSVQKKSYCFSSISYPYNSVSKINYRLGDLNYFLVQISMNPVQGKIYGVYNTVVGGNSTAAKPIINRTGQYPSSESPDKVYDGNLSTKYLSFGRCSINVDGSCGIHSGFYLELERGPTLVIGFRICTGDDRKDRDPVIVSLEGSNSTGEGFINGNSWTLLYKGPSGLNVDPGRKKCGPMQYFNNEKQYKSYRFLVSAIRAGSECVQYSEVELYTYWSQSTTVGFLYNSSVF